MNELIYQAIVSKLSPLGYYNKNYFVEIITRNGVKEPAQWTNNEYKAILDIDKYDLYFIRLNGNIQVTESDDVACDTTLTKVLPLKLVSIVKKKEFGCDSFVDFKHVSNIEKYLIGTYKIQGFESVYTTLKTSNLDRNISNEYTGKEIDFEYSIVQIDFTLTLVGNVNCFEKYGC